jgi:hypothetical protein
VECARIYENVNNKERKRIHILIKSHGTHLQKSPIVFQEMVWREREIERERDHRGFWGDRDRMVGERE